MSAISVSRSENAFEATAPGLRLSRTVSVGDTDSDVALSARGLRKDYRRGRAVDGVDLTVAAGERVGLLGPNGAGKTTTLLMCLGAVSPDAGNPSTGAARHARAAGRAIDAPASTATSRDAAHRSGG